MRIEFFYRTYSLFGSDATLNLASHWLNSRIQDSYGGKINSILVEACCYNVSPAKKTLETLNERFTGWLDTLPVIEVVEGEKELRLCYKAIGYTHDEIARDSQVLSVKSFQRTIGKAADLLELLPTKLPTLKEFNAPLLIEHLRAAREETPKTLSELVEIYRQVREAKQT